jgi:hypothetical protein
LFADANNMKQPEKGLSVGFPTKTRVARLVDSSLAGATGHLVLGVATGLLSITVELAPAVVKASRSKTAMAYPTS